MQSPQLLVTYPICVTVLSRHLYGVTEEAHENISHDSPRPCRDLKRLFAEIKSRIIAFQQT
jgi:hypothetical protein